MHNYEYEIIFLNQNHLKSIISVRSELDCQHPFVSPLLITYGIYFILINSCINTPLVLLIVHYVTYIKTLTSLSSKSS